jgi:hypothetical protein
MSKPPAATEGLVSDLADLRRRLTTLEAMAVRPEAAQSLHDALPKGIIARQSLTTNSPAYASPSDSDFVLSDITARADRTYTVWLKAQFVPSDLSNWLLCLTVFDGTNTVGVDRFWREAEAGGNARTVATGVLWEPPTDGVYTLRVRQILATGAGTITYQADPAVTSSAAKRSFWLRDEGPRPS